MGIPACAAAKSAQTSMAPGPRANRSMGTFLSSLFGKAGEPRAPGRLAANEHRNMELENTPKAGCLANGDTYCMSQGLVSGLWGREASCVKQLV